MPRPRIDAAGIGGSGPMGFKGSRVRIPPSRPLIPNDLAPREGRFRFGRATFGATSSASGARPAFSDMSSTARSPETRAARETGQVSDAPESRPDSRAQTGPRRRGACSSSGRLSSVKEVEEHDDRNGRECIDE